MISKDIINAFEEAIDHAKGVENGTRNDQSVRIIK